MKLGITLESKRQTLSWLMLSMLYAGVVTNVARAEFEPLVNITQPGPWPAVTQLIAYAERIWLVNSEPYVNTNAADVYSYSPNDGSVRYERSLFSQDVGTPTVHDGLLYLPFEDPRRSASVGEFAVTDGLRWHWEAMAVGKAFHLHAMGTCFDRLLAVTGAWTGQLLASDDAGRNWELMADLPAGKASFSRLTGIKSFNDRCMLTAAANGDPGAKLYEWTGDDLIPIASWPDGDKTDAMVVFNNELIAWIDKGDRRVTSAFDGERTRQVSLPAGQRPRGFAAHGESLLMISSNRNGGALWETDDTHRWRQLQAFEQTPVSVLSADGQIYVGTYHRTGGGLYGPANGSIASSKASNANPHMTATKIEAKNATAITTPAHADTGTTDLLSLKFPNKRPNRPSVAYFNKRLGTKLEQVQSDFFADDGLRALLARPPILHSKALGELFARQINGTIPEDPVDVFGNRKLPHHLLALWFLNTTMAVNGYGRVLPNSLSPPWRGSDHSSQKFFDPTIGAIVAAGWLKQSDRPTLKRLIGRLRARQDPQWLRSDVIGALTAITDQRFGHDVAKWLSWWDALPDVDRVD